MGGWLNEIYQSMLLCTVYCCYSIVDVVCFGLTSALRALGNHIRDMLTLQVARDNLLTL